MDSLLLRQRPVLRRLALGLAKDASGQVVHLSHESLVHIRGASDHLFRLHLGLFGLLGIHRLNLLPVLDDALAILLGCTDVAECLLLCHLAANTQLMQAFLADSEKCRAQVLKDSAPRRFNFAIRLQVCQRCIAVLVEDRCVGLRSVL